MADEAVARARSGHRLKAVVAGGGSAGLVDLGRRALGQGRFDDARRSFEAALRAGAGPEAYEGLGWTAMWQEEPELTVESFEEAHRRFLERDDRRGAARTAGWLAYSYGSLHGLPAVAGGWAERALRLLEGLAPGSEHAWLAAAAGIGAIARGDTQEARSRGRGAADVARGLARPDLEALGLALEGRAMVAEGDVAAGMRMLDEAAVTAIASDSEDFACVAATCCAMLAACELTGDLERATEWCERTSAYAERYGFRSLFAICRSSYAGVLVRRGRWEEAEAELRRAEREFAAVRPPARGQAVVHLAELERRRGRFAEAQTLLSQIEGARAGFLVAAALALDTGDLERARDLAERYLRQTPAPDRAERAVALELAVRAGAELGEHRAGAPALEEVRTIVASAPTEPLLALAASAEGLHALAAGDPERARRHLEDAVDRFGRSGAPFEAARARLDLARALAACGRGAAAAREAEAAREGFARLGAAHGTELAAELLGRLAEPAEAPAAAPVAELTARELDVLALIAAGLSNRAIATRLVVSEHTVHRHTTNLYRKLGVSSRAAATACAFRHGLAGGDGRDWPSREMASSGEAAGRSAP